MAKVYATGFWTIFNETAAAVGVNRSDSFLRVIRDLCVVIDA
jgi:hypothetical protein